MAVKDFTNVFPSAKNTVANMPTLVNKVDRVRASHPNAIVEALFAHEDEIGDDSLPAGSLRANVSDLQTSMATHASQHKGGGSDAIDTVDTSNTGLCPVLSGNSSQFLNGAGSFSVPSGIVPSAHATEHVTGGSDTIAVATDSSVGLCPILSNNSAEYLNGAGSWATPKLDDLATPDDNTDLNATTSAHGLLKKLDDNAAHFLDGQGNWSTPSGIVPSAHAAEHITGGSDTIAVATDSSVGLCPILSGNSSQFLDGTGSFSVPSGVVPSAHASDHITGGSDTIAVVTGSSVGLCPILSGNSSQFLDGSGSWSTPSGGTPGSHASSHISSGGDAIAVVTASTTGLCPILSNDSEQYLDGTGSFSIPDKLYSAAGTVNIIGVNCTTDISSDWSVYADGEVYILGGKIGESHTVALQTVNGPLTLRAYGDDLQVLSEGSVDIIGGYGGTDNVDISASGNINLTATSGIKFNSAMASDIAMGGNSITGALNIYTNTLISASDLDISAGGGSDISLTSGGIYLEATGGVLTLTASSGIDVNSNIDMNSNDITAVDTVYAAALAGVGSNNIELTSSAHISVAAASSLFLAGANVYLNSQEVLVDESDLGSGTKKYLYLSS